MLAPEVRITAPPFKHRLGLIDVKAVVVAPAQSKDRSAAILPVRSSEQKAQYQNRMGATFEAKGMMAVFPMSVLSEKNEVRIVYDSEICTDAESRRITAECVIRFRLDKVR
jgi:hypothetical protein